MHTVMLVDDNPAVRRLVHVTLGAGTRFRILHAENGAEALKIAQTQPVDVVLLDVAMPGADGYTVCRALKALPPLTRPIVFMLTARASQSDRARAREVGADDFLTKPFSPVALLDRVETALKTRPARSA